MAKKKFNMIQEMDKLKLKDKHDINILLLGETGIGKSTFINSLANYLQNNDLKSAEKKELLVLIPTTMRISDKFYEVHDVELGTDVNEFQEVGASATQDVKTYVFPLGAGKARLRLIDTPGMGDTRGIQQDDENCENILSYISQLNELHGICFLFRPNEARITVQFEYCVKQILSRLEKTAGNNIIFVFTHTKGTNYEPGETLALLKKVVKDIQAKPPYVTIKLKNNIFCVDNEGFRYLAGIKEGIQFEDNIKSQIGLSWKNSSSACWRMISYIIGDASNEPLVPHKVKNTTSINETRRLIHQLAQPLAEITQLIQDNIRILDRRESELQMKYQSLDDLKKKLYVPVVNLNVIKLSQPITVCASEKCRELIKVEGEKLWHYKERCHDPCYLINVPKEIIGAPQLSNCAAINKSTKMCMQCGCSQTCHMHVYYMTKPFDDKKIDVSVQNNITTMENAVREAAKITQNIQKRKSQLEEERETIIRCTAQFAHFLQNNAITPFNDSYQTYIEYIIQRERSLGYDADKENIYHLEQLLATYEGLKSAFDQALQLQKVMGKGHIDVYTKAEDILKSVAELYSLTHNGQKIKEMCQSQQTSRKKEYEKTEYVHNSPALKPTGSKGKSSDGETKKKNKQQSKQNVSKLPPPNNPGGSNVPPHQRYGPHPPPLLPPPQQRHRYPPNQGPPPPYDPPQYNTPPASRPKENKRVLNIEISDLTVGFDATKAGYYYQEGPPNTHHQNRPSHSPAYRPSDGYMSAPNNHPPHSGDRFDGYRSDGPRNPHPRDDYRRNHPPHYDEYSRNPPPRDNYYPSPRDNLPRNPFPPDNYPRNAPPDYYPRNPPPPQNHPRNVPVPADNYHRQQPPYGMVPPPRDYHDSDGCIPLDDPRHDFGGPRGGNNYGPPALPLFGYNDRNYDRGNWEARHNRNYHTNQNSNQHQSRNYNSQNNKPRSQSQPKFRNKKRGSGASCNDSD